MTATTASRADCSTASANRTKAASSTPPGGTATGSPPSQPAIGARWPNGARSATRWSAHASPSSGRTSGCGRPTRRSPHARPTSWSRPGHSNATTSTTSSVGSGRSTNSKPPRSDSPPPSTVNDRRSTGATSTCCRSPSWSRLPPFDSCAPNLSCRPSWLHRPGPPRCCERCTTTSTDAFLVQLRHFFTSLD